MLKKSVLVTGAGGQIGTALLKALSRRYGVEGVVATDIREVPGAPLKLEKLDVLDRKAVEKCCREREVGQIYHLAAVLSANAEKAPRRSWEINMEGLFNVLDAARAVGARVFYPSSIAVFGKHSPPTNTPQYAVQQPQTVYGISKVAGESWCEYYFDKYQLDTRSVRFPGLISYDSPPGGGTTDYAVDIYHHAVQGKPYHCFLREDARLPMLYMPDAVRAMIELMEAPGEQISVRSSYNLKGMSLTPGEIATAIRQHLPAFQVEYRPDFRQEIADSWSKSIDDSHARKDWGWQPEYTLESMTRQMLEKLGETYQTV